MTAPKAGSRGEAKSVGADQFPDGPPLGFSKSGGAKLAPLGLSPAAPDVPAHIGTGRRASASGASTSSAVREATSEGAEQFFAGPPQEKLAPSGGSAVREATNVGASLYICHACGLIYDETKGDADSGLALGTRFADIPDDWRCPLCGVTKADFEPYIVEEPSRATCRSVRQACAGESTIYRPIPASATCWQRPTRLKPSRSLGPV